MNKKFMNLKMQEKFKKSFFCVNVGTIVIAVIGIGNIVMLYASLPQDSTSIRRCIIAIVLLTVAVAVNMSMCNTVCKQLATSIVEPVHELQNVVQKVKNGEFDINISYEGQDELAELAENLRGACLQMQTIVMDAGYLLGEMANGRFNVSTNAKDCYVGDFKTLIEGMEKLSYHLDGTLRQIQNASEQVMVGSAQLSGSAQELAEGATNQAGAVEELTATIGNVTNISEESADNAGKAATNAKTAAEDAEKSREEINHLTDAMERITETSKEIENIIGAIEDIAAQTNLLSLNASIEAARAGEAGKGFAVVADQIGKLAADSARSAVMTRELISKSLIEVESGNSMVENTMESINTILADMNAFAEMASGAAEASRVQADMLKQIEVGIDQISAVVQSNSATAQETSAISEELSAQSVNLKEMVAQFVLCDK